jgi:hypothetical protein
VAVQIDQVEVVPREPRQTDQQQPPGSATSGPPQPELTQVIASTVAVLHSRDTRLQAD